MPLTPGSRLGPYEILAAIGAGGMGEVYRARDPRIGRDVAVKVLPESVATEPDRLRRFEHEARAAGALNHPNILTIHDIGSHDGAPYVVTELLEGETLEEVLIRRSPTTRHVLSWAMQAARGLAEAHRQGIVHRDLKPANLFLTSDGRVKVLDFGLAKLLWQPDADSKAATASGLTQPGVVMGTVAYMSPEQVRAESLDHRTDIFSLGVVLSELLCREHPFQRKTVPATLTAILHEDARGLAGNQPGISAGAKRVVERCLEKRREDRFQSAQDLALALESLLEGPGASATLLEVEERSPYPGLSSFTEKDASHFFGREEAVRGLWQKLHRKRLLAVIGPSGAGKTSFVRAGVVASRPDGWAAIVATPGAAPLRGLGQAVGPELAGDPEALRELAAFEDPNVAFDLLARWRRGHEESLVVIDQFEELFTLNEPAAQVRFAALLGRLADEADIHVLLSVRDDFLMRCHDHATLSPVFGDLTPLGALTRDGLRRAVVDPADTKGYRFEDEALVEEILAGVEDVRGALPLLGFAVSRLWERRDSQRRLLTHNAYREIGGVGGALAQHAEATLERIGLQREGIVREIFRNLTTAQGTRAVLPREELLSTLPDRAEGDVLLGLLVDARLLTSYETEGLTEPRGHSVEILHESLLTAWPRLVRWQTQDVDGALLRDQLRKAAHLWQERGETEDLLWTGSSYLEYRAWRERYPGGLSSVEENFGKAMGGLAGRKRRRWRIATGIMAVGLGVYLLVRAQADARLSFAERARRLNGYISRSLLLAQEDPETLRNFFETSGRINRRQFHSIATPMLTRHRYVDALEWLPVVRGPERLTHEEEAHAAGLTEYRLWEAGPDGQPREAGRRPYYVPIQFMEPPNVRALGFDLAANPLWWSVGERARDSGLIVASRPFVMIEDASNPAASPAVALYAPVYLEGDPGSTTTRRASLAGFTAAVFRVAPLAKAASVAIDGSGLAFVMRDVEASGAPLLAEQPPGAAALPRRAGFAIDFPLYFADRVWELQVFALPGAFHPWMRWTIGIGAASILTALLGFIVVNGVRAISRLRRQGRRAPS